MSEVTATRSAVIALKEERRAMQESSAFLDEKCLLLAEAMMNELRRHQRMSAEDRKLSEEAASALHAALMRHGLDGLQCYPAADLGGAVPDVQRRTLMGIALQSARFEAAGKPRFEPVNPSPEAEACRALFARRLGLAAQLAAVAGNLDRLYHEYRRTVRRVRALEDVLLPEIDRTASEIEAQLEELEQDEALWVRRASGAAR